MSTEPDKRSTRRSRKARRSRTAPGEDRSTPAPGDGAPVSRRERRLRRKTERSATGAERLASRHEQRASTDGTVDTHATPDATSRTGTREPDTTGKPSLSRTRARSGPKASKSARERGLVVEAIDVHYGKVQALRDVSLEIKPGEMVALLGANGAGKTTTLRTISGMLAPTQGRVLFEGEEITGLPAHDVVGRGIAHMPEGRELFPTLTVEENLRFGYYSKLKTDKKGYRDQLEKVMDLFPRLRERRDQAAGTMSGGEQQMLTAARAMMSAPRLLLVDELSLGLAPMIVSDLFQALHDVNKEGTSVLIVEQFIHLALENTKRAYALTKGEIVLEGKSKELADDPELIEAYLGGDGGDAGEKSAANGAKDGPSNRKKSEAARKG